MKYDPIMCMMVDDSVKTEDAMFVQLKFGSGRTEGAKLEENEYREYAEALLKKYGEKRVTLSKQGKVIVTYTNPNDSKTIDHAIRSCDSREDDIADELFDALQQIGKRNINKNEAEFISEKFFDGKVSSDELMRIFNKYKKEYL
nr:MAG TPA: hypothetical protein [Caudoviricetes sp.]